MQVTGEIHMKQKNKGFTLIELIVTIAIIAIFSGVVLTVVGTGAHSYRTASSNAKVQMETQDVMDQIQNIIIDVNRSVYYTYGDAMNSSVGDLVSNDIDSNGDASGTAMSKTFMACSGKESSDSAGSEDQGYDYSCDIIMWNKQEQKLYYACRTWKGTESVKNGTTDDSGVDSGADENGTPTVNESSANGTSAGAGSETEVLDITDSDMEVADTTSDGENMGTTVSTRTSEIQNKVDKTVLAENITDFRVDVSKAVSERIIRFQFTADVNGKETTTVHTVNLRNQIQISKPEDGYGKSDGDTPWILLTNYPTEIEPGKSVTGFSKLMNGNIDPDTVKWVVESGKGVFTAGITGAEDSAVTLKASDDAQDGDTITIHVEARTTDGKTVTSKSGIIKVVNKKVPLELVPSVTDVLLGAGNNYDLTSIKWKIKYSDGTYSEELPYNSLTWSELSNIEDIAFSNGQINIGENAGITPENAIFNLNVMYTSQNNTMSNLSGIIHIKIARLDIIPNNGKYKVGEKKPDFKCIYKEGGNEDNNKINGKVSLSFISIPEGKTFSNKDSFTVNDVGKWMAKTNSVDISSLNGFPGGSLKANCQFEVESSVEQGTIKLNNKSINTIVAGGRYYCSRYNSEHFQAVISQGSNKYEIKWSIEGATNTKFKNGKAEDTEIHTDHENKDVYLDVGPNERGFKLKADITTYRNESKSDVIERRYFATLNVNVVTDIKIQNTFDNSNDPNANYFQVTKGRDYTLNAIVHVWSYNAETQEHTQSNLAINKNCFYWNPDLLYQDNKTSWKVEDNRTDFKLKVGVNPSNGNNVPNVYAAEGSWSSIIDEKEIKVKEPPITISLKDESGQVSGEMYPDETINLKAEITVDGKKYVPSNLEWHCITPNGQDLGRNAFSGNGLERTFYLPNDQRKPGKYTLKISYTMKGSNALNEAYYNVTVKEYTVTAEIIPVNNKTSLLPGDSLQLYLKLQNEKGLINARANWSVIGQNAYLNTYYRENIYQNGKNLPITVMASNNITTNSIVTITASYTLPNQQSKTITIDINLCPLAMYVNISQNDMYYTNSASDISEITADITNVNTGESVTSQYDIEWELNPVDGNIYCIQENEGVKTHFSLLKSPDNMKTVSVTAKAKIKNTTTVVCSASDKINIHPMKTVNVSYSCPVGAEQKLEFKNADKDYNIKSITASYRYTVNDELQKCEITDIPLMNLNRDGNKLKIKMHSNDDDFENYKYIIISAYLENIIYNFYIYPTKNNVFDENGNAITYVPTDVETICKLTNKSKHDKESGYTFVYKDSTGKNCELRLSVYDRTGIGYFPNNNCDDSSAGKWFMKRASETKWYRLKGNNWYPFHNGKADGKGDKEKSQYIRYYWDLNDSITMYDNSGNELNNGEKVQNTYFWKKWS